MNDSIEQRARGLLAAEYERSGYHPDFAREVCVEASPSFRAIRAALSQAQPAEDDVVEVIGAALFRDWDRTDRSEGGARAYYRSVIHDVVACFRGEGDVRAALAALAAQPAAQQGEAAVDEARWQAFGAALGLNLEEVPEKLKALGVTSRYKWQHTSDLWEAWKKSAPPAQQPFVPEWQSIETAPVRTRVLVTGGDTPNGVCIATSDPGRFTPHCEGHDRPTAHEWYSDTSRGSGKIWPAPTHWMPLLAAPQPQEGNGNG